MIIKTLSRRVLSALDPMQRIAAEIKDHLYDFRRLRRNRKLYIDEDTGAVMVGSSMLWVGQFGLLLPSGKRIYVPNSPSFEGLDHLLDIEYNGGTQVTTWYLAPFSDNATPATDWTHANFNGTKATEATNYDEATRQAWNEAAAVNGVMSSSSDTNLTASSGGITIHGAALVSDSTKSSVSSSHFLAAAGNYGSAVTYAAAKTAGLTFQITIPAS